MVGVHAGSHYSGRGQRSAGEYQASRRHQSGRPQPSARRSPDGLDSVSSPPHHGGGFRPDGGLPTRTGPIR